MSIHDMEEHVIEAAERWADAHVRGDNVTPEESALLDAVDALRPRPSQSGVTTICPQCRMESVVLYLSDRGICWDCEEERERDRMAYQADRVYDEGRDRDMTGGDAA
jgi:hypothetical protein